MELAGVIERLNAEGIAGEEAGALPLVPNCKGEHAAQLAHAFRSQSFVEMKQHLRIRM